jgi:hypothetical protein
MVEILKDNGGPDADAIYGDRYALGKARASYRSGIQSVRRWYFSRHLFPNLESNKTNKKVV